MKIATVRDLRTSFPKVERWIAEGESVAITKRRRVVATLVPPPPEARRTITLPNFAQRTRDTFGSKRLSGKASKDLRQAMRGDR